MISANNVYRAACSVTNFWQLCNSFATLPRTTRNYFAPKLYRMFSLPCILCLCCKQSACWYCLYGKIRHDTRATTMTIIIVVYNYEYLSVCLVYCTAWNANEHNICCNCERHACLFYFQSSRANWQMWGARPFWGNLLFRLFTSSHCTVAIV